jgi:acetylornithine deacetylase/succinyl-diaminopimelate desuccinylase-like protein
MTLSYNNLDSEVLAMMRNVVAAGVIVAAMGAAPAGVAAGQQGTVADLIKEPAVKAALDAAKASEPETIDDEVRFCEIPAPSFKEEVRGQELKRVFTQLGLQNVRVDKVGNVLGDRPGLAARPHLVLAAHLDTVFPEGTDVKVRREGPVLHGPGIGDDCRGLAVMVSVIRSLKQANVQTPGTITFVANVGEEGLGDLRGMKELFNQTLKGQVDKFVSIDGTGLSVTHTFVGSHRYRVTFKGPGGHSFGAFGLANPIDALGRAIAKIAEFQVPSQPKTTFNVGRIGGGTSVNSIPFEAWMEVDMRSVDKAALTSVDANFHKAVDAALVEENTRWGHPNMLTVTKDLVGDRPAGAMRDDDPTVKAAMDATRVLGWTATNGVGSSDANYPCSLGIPSLDIGGGGKGTEAHALGEAFDTTNSWQGTQRALLLTVALAR